MPPRAIRVAAAVALLLAVPAARAAAEPWSLLVDGRPTLAGAAVAPRGATVWVELAAVAPALGIQLLDFERITALRDAEGVLWRLSGDGTRLESAGRSLALGGTAFGLGGRVFLPAATLALLAQRRLSLDPARREVRFTRDDAATGALAAGTSAALAGARAPEGWQPLVMPKPQAQLAAEAEARRIAALANPGFELVVPEDRSSMRLGMGLGHLLGGDWGLDLSAAGSASGLAVSLDALAATTGEAAELIAGRLLVGALDRRWTLEAGDVYGELAGAARGLRLSRALGSGAQSSRWHVDVAAVAPRHDLETGGEERALAGFRWAFDDRGGLLEGGVDSLGGAVGSAVLHRPRGGFAAFGRRRADLDEESYGANARWAPHRRLLAHAGLTRGRQAGDEREEWNAGLTATLAGRAALTAERSSTRLGARRLDSAALGLSFGLGASRWNVRYEDLAAHGAGAPPAERRGLSLFVAAPLASALSLSYQGRLALADGGGGGPWDELALRADLGPRTVLEVAAPVAGGDHEERLRVRLAQRLGERVELIAETGRLAPFSTRPSGEPAPDDRGVRLLVRTHWDVATPAGGAEVAGRVVDSFERPVAGVPVRLGEYRTLTGDDGAWRFGHVPRGGYELAVEPAGLGGRYQAPAPARVEVPGGGGGGTVVRVLEKVEIQGLVCLDRDRDGRCRGDERLAGVAVEASGRLAVTGEDGAFFFAQLAPGRHVVRLVGERLPPGTVPSGATEIVVEVEAGRRTGGYVFLLAPVERPIVFGNVG